VPGTVGANLVLSFAASQAFTSRENRRLGGTVFPSGSTGFSGSHVRSGGQLNRRAGLEAQRRALAATCKRRGWQLLEVVEEAGFSAEDLKRPGLQEALRVLASGEAKALVARKLDRSGEMALRWTAAGMLEAERQFRRVVGYRDLPKLVAAIERELRPSEEAPMIEAA